MFAFVPAIAPDSVGGIAFPHKYFLTTLSDRCTIWPLPKAKALGFFFPMARSNTTVTSAVIQTAISRFKDTIAIHGFSRKYLLIVAAIALVFVSTIGFQIRKRSSATVAGSSTSVSVDINRSYRFGGITGQGQRSPSPIAFTIKNAEKTDRVIVKDQTFVAKNSKMFFILNLELKNETIQPLNILPGDLIRLTYNGDQTNKYAPDLHNNLVLVAPISTKLDRVGFVIPGDARDIKLHVGELEGNKDGVQVEFSS